MGYMCVPMDANLHEPILLELVCLQFRKSLDRWGHYRQKMTSNVRVHERQDIPCRPVLKCSLTLTHTRFVSLTANPLSKPRGLPQRNESHLYANGDIWEDPQVDFRPFDLFDVPLNDLFGSLELLGRKPDSVALYTEAPFAVSESCAFGGTSDRDRNDTLVSFDVFNLPRSELVSEPDTQNRG